MGNGIEQQIINALTKSLAHRWPAGLTWERLERVPPAGVDAGGCGQAGNVWAGREGDAFGDGRRRGRPGRDA